MYQVPGHIDLGMWGNVKVAATIPEFSTLAVLGIIAAVIAVTLMYRSKENNIMKQTTKSLFFIISMFLTKLWKKNEHENEST